MHSPESMQAFAHLADASGPSPVRTMLSTPPMTSAGAASAMPAGLTLGQTSTHRPQRVQASSIAPTRAPNAVSNVISFIGFAHFRCTVGSADRASEEGHGVA
jgi:hypothetical protein